VQQYGEEFFLQQQQGGIEKKKGGNKNSAAPVVTNTTRPAIDKEAKKQLNKLQRQLDDTDILLTQLKKEKQQLEIEMAKPEVYTQSNRLIELQKKQKQLDQQVEQSNKSWEKLFEEISQIEGIH
jgi:ATP-binding cassette subfamily F protein 3